MNEKIYGQNIERFSLQGAVALSKSSNRSDESDSLGLSTTESVAFALALKG